jgi:hypothetical protein
MNTLTQALASHQLIVLRVIGEWWEQDLTGLDLAQCVRKLAVVLSEVDLATELSYLHPEEAEAVYALIEAGGQMPVATYSRQFGEERQMGPGRLEREEPWLDPISPTEALWYRGFIYRGFGEADEGMVEYYYMPDELLAQVKPEASEAPPLVVRETPPDRSLTDVPPAERASTAAPLPEKPAPTPKPVPATATGKSSAIRPISTPDAFTSAPTDAVDDLTTLLGTAQRNALNEGNMAEIAPFLLVANSDRRSLLLTLAWEMGLLRRTGEGIRPTRQAVEWLKQTRTVQQRALLDAWSNSAWNELRRTPGLALEGSGWENDPILARTALLEALQPSPAWFAVADVIAAIKTADPDFQRPNGDYSSWYIRDEATDAFLPGFENWDKVEGRLLRFLLDGPAHWLGLVDRAEGALRLSPVAQRWLADQPETVADTPLPLIVQPDAVVIVPLAASRYYRFQVSRVADMQAVQAGKPYLYRVSPQSLTAARLEGIEPSRVIQFLQEASGQPLPTSTERAIERWAEFGAEARLETMVVLRVRDVMIIDKLRRNAKTRPYLGEALGDLAVAVRADEWEKLMGAAAQLGLLLDAEGA